MPTARLARARGLLALNPVVIPLMLVLLLVLFVFVLLTALSAPAALPAHATLPASAAAPAALGTTRSVLLLLPLLPPRSVQLLLRRLHMLLLWRLGVVIEQHAPVPLPRSPLELNVARGSRTRGARTLLLSPLSASFVRVCFSGSAGVAACLAVPPELLPDVGHRLTEVHPDAPVVSGGGRRRAAKKERKRWRQRQPQTQCWAVEQPTWPCHL
jgi:hypothetical protein